MVALTNGGKFSYQVITCQSELSIGLGALVLGKLILEKLSVIKMNKENPSVIRDTGQHRDRPYPPNPEKSSFNSIILILNLILILIEEAIYLF